MGLRLGISDCRCDSDPDPMKFEITTLNVVGNFIIATINYLNCTNFEGKKILVFEGVSAKEIRSLRTIDPHFCDDDHISPIARFEPTNKGLCLAFAMANTVK